MIIKKFQAQTETEAIMLAKEELGKDAIVMNIKVIKPRGLYKLFKKPTVEVTAAADEEVVYSEGEKMLSELQKLKQEKVTAEPEKPLVQPQQTTLPPLRTNPNIYNNPNIIIEDDDIGFGKASSASTASEAAASESAIEQKLNELQKMMEKQIQEKEDVVKKSGEEEIKKISEEPKKEGRCAVYIRLVKEQLIHNEVDPKYAEQILDEIKSGISEESTVDNVLSSVYQKIVLKIGQLKTISLEENSPKFIFFIGPTGVGKTTTIAKIASDLKLKKKANVAVVTSDTYRIAAVDQLRTYANILGIPLKVIYTPEEIGSVREEFSNYDIVLIDTAGRSHHSEEQKEDISRLLAMIPENERDVYLVLSVTTKYKDLIKITELYNELSRYNLIFTKMDETECIGNILNIHMLTGAPLSYTTYGQNVPDDIGSLDAQEIAKKVLGGNN